MEAETRLPLRHNAFFYSMGDEAGKDGGHAAV